LPLKKHNNVCLRLCASIMSQQLSTKVAKVIFERFLVLYPPGEPTPENILATPVEALRGIGLSGAKAAYVHNVARYFLDESLSDKSLQRMSDEEVMETLLPIKGVGRWTAEISKR
jgi:DNA-3-methyladenine glycosylase II